MGVSNPAGVNPLALKEIADPDALIDTGHVYTNDISGSTELMYKDDSGNEVQITNNGDLNAGDAFVDGGNSFAGLATIGTNDANSLAFEVNNTEVMRIDQSASLNTVLIGKTSTAFGTSAKLEVEGGTLRLNNTGGIPLTVAGGTGFANRADFSVVIEALAGDATQPSIIANGDSDLGFYFPGSSLIAMAAGGAQFANFGPNGFEVTTGGLLFNERADHATTPTAAKGELWVRSDTPNVLVFTDDAGTDTVLGGGAADAFVNDGNSFAGLATIGTNDANSLAFEVNNTEVMRIDQSASLNTVLIGKTSTAFGTSAKLEVDGGELRLNNTGGKPLTVAGGTGFANRADFSVVIEALAGSASQPSIIGDGDSDLGIYFPGGTTVAMAGGGAQFAAFKPAGIEITTGGLLFNERADHANTPTAAKGELWVRSDTPNVLVFTDDAGTDTVLGGGSAATIKSTFFDGDIDTNFGMVGPQAQSSTGVDGFGLWSEPTETDGSSSIGLDTDGYFLEQDTGSSLNADAITFLNPSIDAVHAREINSILVYSFKLGQTANTRGFFGFTDQSGATMVGADDPAGSYSGIQFRAADTNFFFVSKDNTTLSRVDSGIALDTDLHYIRITYTESVPNCKVELLDASFSVEASNTFTSNLPAASTDLGFCMGIENRTGGAGRSWKQYGGYGMNRP